MKFVLVVFHHDFQKTLIIVSFGNCSSKTFSQNYTLVETHSYQKLTILNSPTSLAEEEGSATK